eukprot:jgi/Tetstr1/461946/TSEL_007024.t1
MAGINTANLQAMPEDQKGLMLAMLEQAQIRDSLNLYNRLVERCFTDCVDTFRRKDLDTTEEKCVLRCTEKFLKCTARTGMRFSELTQAFEDQMAAKQGGGN